MKDRIRLWSGRAGRGATSQALRLIRFPLFCVLVFASVRLALAATTELVPMSLNATASYTASGRGTMSAVTTKTLEKAHLPRETQTFTNKTDREISELKPTPNWRIGMEIVAGVGLFLWVQRVRNFSI
jgi:hypothetical protein